MTALEGDKIVQVDQNALLAVNERLRDDYVKDCQLGVDRWNKVMKRYKIDFRFELPHRGFHRAIGTFADIKVSPDGQVIGEAEWTKGSKDWLPTEQDRAFVCSLMTKPITEPGKFASWVAPPSRGIDGHPLDFDYVRFN